MLNLSQLKRVMKRYAEVISGRKVRNDRPLDIYLPEGGFGTATPRRIFKSFVRYALYVNGNPLKTWPKNWPDMSINELAPRLL